MKTIDLSSEHESLYFNCLEDWSEEMKESGDHKCLWYGKMKDKGLRVKLALDDSGEVGGMIQFYPCEYSNIEAKDLYFISCIWVHGYKEGRGNFQKKGMGSALLAAAEKAAKDTGASGIAAWGISLPFWMKASWYKKHGYLKTDKDGMAVLLWKKFKDDAVPPKWIKQKKTPSKSAGKVTVTAFIHGGCPAQNIVFERAKRAAEEFGDKVEFVKIDTSDREVFLEWGILDALFIDGKSINTGPPPKYEKLFKIIANKVKKL